ncbi:P-loop containing nucleoside triphosphate hydrolase protein [Chytriomyces sp. MP71]|nr:P-loop containing nucleoside triphosphate hydrolase protein [Chytriomyces sp. MP71]
MLDTSIPWPRDADRRLFGKDGTAPFRRHSHEYGEFREFYAKYRQRAASQRQRIDSEVAFAEDALQLFSEYLQRKRVALEAKIEKDRNGLPIKAFAVQIVDAVRAHKVVLVAADTGAGKSTQVPQYLLAAGFDKIACTQPRRIACYSLARRVSYESLNAYGSEIAYQVRFEGTKSSKTRVLFLTEGLLLRQFASDSKLSNYNVIIVDEVWLSADATTSGHALTRRHLGDFLLGVLKRLLDIRPDLRIVLMSATINATLFSNYFNAPCIEVPGRMYPVKIEYLPIEPEEDRNLVDPRLVSERERLGTVVSIQAKPGKMKTTPYLRILERIDQVIPAHERGDLLVFLSGMNEITTLADELRNYATFTRRWIILKLHSSLSVQEQEKVFDVAPPGLRKCILTTNIAETSVTIDGVRFIIDSGRVKEMSYDAHSRLSRLAEFWISQSSAKQRAGRAGRTGPGECFRFYTEREFGALNAFPVPEILRTPLEPLLLQTMAYGLGDPREFDFIEKPASDAVEGAMRRLSDLGAMEVAHSPFEGDVADSFQLKGKSLTSGERLTALGRVLAVLPMDVVLGKMLVLGSISDVVDATIIMAAALTVPNPFVKVPDGRMDISENRRQLESDYGDPFTLMNLFSDWLKVKADRRDSSANWCKRRGVEEQRLYEMVKLKTQFEQVLAQYLGREDLQEGETDSDGESGQRALSGKRKRSQRKAEENDLEGLDEEEKLRRKMFWKDPEYIKRKEQRLFLDQQRRAQSSGKRKFLRFEDGDDADNEAVAEQEDITDVSIHHLEFSLSHDPTALLAKSDTAGLTKRDANMIRLVVSSGLYPHLAIADDSNSFKAASEQVFHTKTKRFVKMLPTSVFASKPELLHPKEISAPSELRNQSEAPIKETLESIRPKQEVSELLCYLELLETNKPYLTNVIRVPAAPDSNTRARIVVLGNWLRIAWEYVLSKKLKNVKHGLAKDEQASDNEDLDVDEEIEIMGTSVQKAPETIGLETASTINQSTHNPISRRLFKKRVASDWGDISFLPLSVKRIHHDWEMGTSSYEEVPASDDFENMEEFELSQRLGEFLDLDFNCSVEKLRMQDVPNWFGYDPFKLGSENPMNGSETKLFRGGVQITPYMHYFVADPKSLTSRKREKLHIGWARRGLEASGTRIASWQCYVESNRNSEDNAVQRM